MHFNLRFIVCIIRLRNQSDVHASALPGSPVFSGQYVFLSKRSVKMAGYTFRDLFLYQVHPACLDLAIRPCSVSVLLCNALHSFEDWVEKEQIPSENSWFISCIEILLLLQILFVGHWDVSQYHFSKYMLVNERSSQVCMGGIVYCYVKY